MGKPLTSFDCRCPALILLLETVSSIERSEVAKLFLIYSLKFTRLRRSSLRHSSRFERHGLSHITYAFPTVLISENLSGDL